MKYPFKSKDEDLKKYLFNLKETCIVEHEDNWFKEKSHTKLYPNLEEAKALAKGKAIVNILSLAQFEKITAIQKISNYDENLFVLMATSKGIIKKTKLVEFSRPRSSGSS